MSTQTTGAGDRPYPDLAGDGGGSGESGGQRAENDFDRAASRPRVGPTPRQGVDPDDGTSPVPRTAPDEDSARGLVGGE
jgi:hypothetical protein